MKFFIKDFCEIVQDRVFIFGMQVDNGVLNRGIANQPSSVYTSLYLSDFLSFHTLNDEIFVKDFSETVQARVFIFGMQVDNDVLYRGIANQPTPVYSSLYLSIFLSLYSFVKDTSSTVWDKNFKFGMQVQNDKLYHGIENGSSPVCSSLYLFIFLSLQIFRQRYVYIRLR